MQRFPIYTCKVLKHACAHPLPMVGWLTLRMPSVRCCNWRGQAHQWNKDYTERGKTNLWVGLEVGLAFSGFRQSVTPNLFNQLRSVRQHTSPLYGSVCTAAICVYVCVQIANCPATGMFFPAISSCLWQFYACLSRHLLMQGQACAQSSSGYEGIRITWPMYIFSLGGLCTFSP